MNGRIFICHASRDADSAMELLTQLESRGLACWLAPRDVPTGADYASEVGTALSRASGFVILVSRHSSASDHCAREVELAIRQGLRVTPVRLDDHPLSPALDYRLATSQVIGFAEADLVDKLMGVIRESSSKDGGDPPEARIAARPQSLVDSAGRVEPIRLSGRTDELRRARAAIESARDQSTGRLLLIRGESGVGKSALAQAIAQIAAECGFVVARTVCEPFHEGMSFFPVRELMRQLSASDIKEVIQQIYGRGSAQASMAAVAELTTVEPTARRDAIVATFANLVFGQASLGSGQPTLLFVEDLERVDAGTTDSLLCVLARFYDGPVVIMGTYRTDIVNSYSSSHPLVPLLSAANRGGDRTLWLDLGPIPRSALSGMIEAILEHGYDFPHSFVDKIWRETEGNALFVREVLKSLQSSPAHEPGLEFEAERKVWRLRGDLNGWRTPTSVEAAIKTRLDGMDGAARGELERASVIGRRFAFEVMCSLTESDEIHLLERLEECIHLSLIQESPDADDWFEFTHGKVREVLYESMSRIRRRRMHSVVADALQEMRGSLSEDWEALIGEHLYQAGRYPESVPVLFQAATQLLRLSAGSESAALLEKAIDAARRSAERSPIPVSDIEVLRMRAYAVANSYGELERLACELKGDPSMPAITRGWAWGYLGNVAWTRGSFDLAVEAYGEAEKVALTESSVLLEAEVVADFAEAYERAAEQVAGIDEQRSGFYRIEAQRYQLRQQQLAAEIADPQARARALRNQAKRLRRADRVTDAIAMYEESIALTDPRVATHTVLISYAKTLRFAGRYDDARLAVDRVLEWSAQTGARRSLAIAYHYRAMLIIDSNGPVSEALDDLKRALAVHSEIGYERGLWEVRLQIGRWHALRGDWMSALVTFRRALGPAITAEDDAAVVGAVIRQLHEIDEHEQACALEQTWKERP